jgi:hypothetical protein
MVLRLLIQTPYVFCLRLENIIASMCFFPVFCIIFKLDDDDILLPVQPRSSVTEILVDPGVLAL